MPDNSSANKQPAHSKIAGMSRPIFWIVLIVLVLAIGGGAYAYYQMQQTNAAAAVTAQQATLQTATARTGNIILRASGTGTLSAASESNLGFKTSGVLTTLNVQVGGQVKAGDLIAQLDSSKQQLALSQAQQALNELTSSSAIATAQQAIITAQTNLANAQNVLNGDLAAGSNYSAVNNAQAALTLAQTTLTENQQGYQHISGGLLTNPVNAMAY